MWAISWSGTKRSCIRPPRRAGPTDPARGPPAGAEQSGPASGHRVVSLFRGGRDRTVERPMAAVDRAEVLVRGDLARELRVLRVDIRVVLAARRVRLGIEQHLLGVDEVAPIEVGQLVLGTEPNGIHRAGFLA